MKNLKQYIKLQEGIGDLNPIVTGLAGSAAAVGALGLGYLTHKLKLYKKPKTPIHIIDDPDQISPVRSGQISPDLSVVCAFERYYHSALPHFIHSNDIYDHYPPHVKHRKLGDEYHRLIHEDRAVIFGEKYAQDVLKHGRPGIDRDEYLDYGHVRHPRGHPDQGDIDFRKFDSYNYLDPPGPGHFSLSDHWNKHYSTYSI